MKAARVQRFGPASVITIDDLPRPEPAAGELLVCVKAAGVGNWDALIREGKVEAIFPDYEFSDHTAKHRKLAPGSPSTAVIGGRKNVRRN